MMWRRSSFRSDRAFSTLSPSSPSVSYVSISSARRSRAAATRSWRSVTCSPSSSTPLSLMSYASNTSARFSANERGQQRAPPATPSHRRSRRAPPVTHVLVAHGHLPRRARSNHRAALLGGGKEEGALSDVEHLLRRRVIATGAHPGDSVNHSAAAMTRVGTAPRFSNDDKGLRSSLARLEPATRDASARRFPTVTRGLPAPRMWVPTSRSGPESSRHPFPRTMWLPTFQATPASCRP